MQERLFVSLQEIAAKKIEAARKVAAGKEAVLIMALILSSLSWGCIDSPGDGVKVITVGASDYAGHIADFSGSGPTRDGRTKPTVVGPGVDVISTVPPGLERPTYVDTYYAKESGTSLSTPVAAGVAALLIQADPGITPAGVKAAMTKGAVKLRNSQGELYEQYYQGAGRLDAYRSYQLLNTSLCGIEPDNWVAGEWAFQSGGKAISPGMNIGADKDIKKLYALAPADQDWTTKFVFFTDKSLTNITSRVTGQVKDWTVLQPLPSSIEANGQEVFGATLTVPDGTSPGIYNGSIEIQDQGRTILSVPITAQVAMPLEINNGKGFAQDVLDKGDWHYYYIDVPLGSSMLRARLSWEKGNGSKLDLFLLAPTSEYYEQQTDVNPVDIEVANPLSGRWLIAVHGSYIPGPESYSLDIERTSLQSTPKDWNVGAVSPGKIRIASFDLENNGPAMVNLTYLGLSENNSTKSFVGAVEDSKTVSTNIKIQSGVKRLAADLTWDNSANDLALRLFDPEGGLADSSANSGDQEEMVGVEDPEPGTWTVEVDGASVPASRDQTFNLDVSTFYQEEWPWLSISGPKSINSGDNGTLEARLAVPPLAKGAETSGYINIGYDNSSFQIPVRVTVAGASLNGNISANPGDKNKDGYYDKLTISAGLNVSLKGSYRLEGMLADCSGSAIDWFSGTKSLQKSGNIDLSIRGSDIWKNGECGPMRIISFFLYNDRGDLIDQSAPGQAINLSPDEFQPLAAYFSGSFTNMTTTSRIGIGVGLKVQKQGNYQVKGRIEDDNGDDLGTDTVIQNLAPGNRTVVLEFNPAKFIMLGTRSSIHLKDLVLTLNGAELDRMPDAWTSKELSPGSIKPGAADNYRVNGPQNSGRNKVVIP